MKNFPQIPEENAPIERRVLNKYTFLKKWIEQAKQSEKEEKYGDAFHYWLGAASDEKDTDKSLEYKSNAEKCLQKWRTKKDVSL